MPSPLIHTAAGLALGGVMGGRALSWRLLFVLGAGGFAAMLPDLDALPGFVTGDLHTYHNQWSHSLIVGLGPALVAGVVAHAVGARFRFWFLLFLLGYGSHVLLDAFGLGRGVMLFWPLSTVRVQSPLAAFYGVKWSAGLWSLHHLVTLANELLFIVSLIVLILSIRRRGAARARRFQGQ